MAEGSSFPEFIEESIVAPLVPSHNLLDCAICDKIWCGLAGYPANEDLRSTSSLGSFKEALSSKCTRHKPLVEWFQQYCIRGGEKRPGRNSKDGVGIRFPRPGVLELTESLAGGLYAKFFLVRRDSVENHCGIARVLDSKWVDISIVDHWRKRCTSSHGKRCDNPTKIWRMRPAWVVDTKENRLVPGSECDSYIALSYRWGKAQGLRIQPDTMTKLQRPEALSDPAVSSRLAPMVRHAISLTPIIGERYIWIDVLCIDHSRATESTEQLQLMGAIYANASLTVVALDCDAEDGLPGLNLALPYRDLDECVIQFGEEQLIQDKRHLDITSNGRYHDRGWTYQEFTMSSRRLIFSKSSLNWMCQCGVSVEQYHPVVEFEKFSNFDMREIMRGMPDLWSLSNILCRYNDRALKYDEDALPGISGLLNVFSRCFSGGFICGIPEMFFEAALSWRPSWEHVSLRRRVPSDRPGLGRLHPCPLPSWSWIGWEGSVNIGGFEAGPARAWGQWRKETFPITTWYTCNSPMALHKRRIRSSWFENREAYKDFGKPLPPGWTRHTVSEAARPGLGKGRDDDILPYPDGCGEYIFQHGRTTKDETESWHWPFPVPDIQESTQPFMPDQTPYLCCETNRAHVVAFQAGKGNDATLYSGRDKVIGTLHLHNKGQLQRFSRFEAGWAAGEEVELVAICRARYYSKTFDEQARRYRPPFKTWEVYMVLWVEWIDGVAYRLACGEVDKAAWEELALEEVSLVLG